MSRSLLAVLTLAHREVIRFVRQRSRLVGALAQPLLFWLLIGAGMRASFKPWEGEGGYPIYLYPGIIALTLLFTAIFATISVVEDRKSGFLQGVLVAPVPRWSIVMGQTAGGTALAVIQASLMLALAPAVGIPLTLPSAGASLGVMALLAFALTALGLTLAWRLDSTRGFHAVMNMLLMPMWLLSGAFFPAEGAPRWLTLVMQVNPMTYGMAALRGALSIAPGAPGAPGAAAAGQIASLPSLAACLVVIVLFGASAFAVATVLARRASA